MKRTMLALLLATGCGGNAKTTPDASADAPAEPAPEEQPAPQPAAEPQPAEVTPQSLYEECRDRVENPQADEECSSDADCKAPGCGSEVCTTAVAAADIMTTCEDKPCFEVLDTCGCHEGQCTWTLKAELPEAPAPAPAPAPDDAKPGNALPPSLPPTKGKEPG